MNFTSKDGLIPLLGNIGPEAAAELIVAALKKPTVNECIIDIQDMGW